MLGYLSNFSSRLAMKPGRPLAAVINSMLEEKEATYNGCIDVIRDAT